MDKPLRNTRKGRDNGVEPMHSFQAGCEWFSQSQDGDIPPLPIGRGQRRNWASCGTIAFLNRLFND
nr:hypothetical protein [Evansella caseinilytica]